MAPEPTERPLLQPGDQPVSRRPAAHEVAQSGVVEADLGHATLASDLQSAADQSLVEAVGGLPHPMHRVQRQLLAMRQEAHSRAELPVRGPRQQVQVRRSHSQIECTHPHREPEHPALLRAPAGLQRVDLGLQSSVDLAALQRLDPPATTLDAVHRLA